jgi:uncharacterized membrane protein YhaH (DUF805 family)
MIVVGLLVVVGAGLAVGVTWIAREISCGEAQPECNDEALIVLLLAIAGLIPGLGMLVASWHQRGHPWRWFLVTAVVYAAVWAPAFSAWVSG